MNDEIQYGMNFHNRIVDSISKIETNHMHPVTVIQSLFAVAVQGTGFQGSYENFKKEMHKVLEEVMEKSRESGLLKLVEENVSDN
jgi:hypothetical protein